MSLGRSSELGEIVSQRQGWQYLSGIWIEINLVQHHLTCFLLVWQLVNQRKIIWCHIRILLNSWRIWLSPLVLGITLVENTVDCTVSCGLSILEIAHVVWDPASVYKDAASLSILVQVRVEWSDHCETLFRIFILLDSDLLVVIKNA